MTNGSGHYDVGEGSGGFKTRLRAPEHRSLNAAGPQTFDHKYMPFAAGKFYFNFLDAGFFYCCLSTDITSLFIYFRFCPYGL